MAEGIETLTPAKVWFKNLGEHMLDVVRFTIEEQMSSLFKVQVTAATSDGTIDLSTLVGKGAALRFSHHSGDLVWAGICAEAGQVKNQPQGGGKSSVYRFIIAPALYRTTLRRNNRVFERKSIKEIVSLILSEWEIPFNMDGLKETYRTQDHRVQYNETDFAFLSRLLEEAGISYYFDSTVKSGLGSAVTSVVFADAPQSETPLTSPFPYLETGRHNKFAHAERPVWDVSIAQHMTFGKTRIADYEFRQVLGSKLYEEAKVPPPDAETQLDYEDYQYIPNAFAAVEDGSEDAVADNKGKVRPVEGEAKDRTRRELGLLRHAQLRVEFSSSAIDLAPGHVFAIGQKSAHHHPNAEVSPERKLLVTGRQIIGDARGADHSRLSAVPADFPHRPQRRTPRPRILGLQSALVVGPAGQEIHADEYGRVRVQFHWDREGVYDDESSCWMRVSQGWAGSSYGMITLPRVGHEVLVAFYEGDPDSPVIVGALFNNTNKIPFKLPENKTRSVWRTESSGGMQSDSPRGFNELAFEDAHGKEAVSLRAERNLSTLVKSSESGSIGKARSTRIGKADSVQIGPPGKDVQIYQNLVGQTTGFQMRSDGEVVLSTTKASIAMKGEDLGIEASEVGLFRAGKKMHISAGPGAIVFLWGGPQVHINPGDAGDINPAPIPLGKAAPPQRGQPMGPPFYPSGGPVAPQPPGGFLEVKVKNPPAPPAPPAAAAEGAIAQKRLNNPSWLESITEPSLDPSIKAHKREIEMALSGARRQLAARKANLARWSEDDQARAKLWFGDSSDATRQMLQQRVDKESALLKKMTVEDFRELYTDGDLIAQVRKNDETHEVEVTKNFYELPTESRTSGTDSKVQTTLHEVSHFDDVSSTTDVKQALHGNVCYGAENSKWLARQDPALAQQNADNFAYWAAEP